MVGAIGVSIVAKTMKTKMAPKYATAAERRKFENGKPKCAS
jgi:hypothetical protein